MSDNNLYKFLVVDSTANDNVDGNITNNIVITGSVNTSSFKKEHIL